MKKEVILHDFKKEDFYKIFDDYMDVLKIQPGMKIPSDLFNFKMYILTKIFAEDLGR